MNNIKEYLSLEVVDITQLSDVHLNYHSDLENELFIKAKEGYPNQVAGFVLGNRGRVESVSEIYPVTNIATNRETSFEIHGLDYLKVENYALTKGLDLIGVYHSHPDIPAIPSEQDLEFAQDNMSYLIISIDGASVSFINSWKKEGFKFINQKIEVK